MNRLIGYYTASVPQSKTKFKAKQKASPLPRRRGRPPKYPKEVDTVPTFIWEAYDCPCAERLYPIIAVTITIFKRDDGWKCVGETAKLLLAMPLSTMKKRLAKFSHNHGPMRGLSATRAGEVFRQVEIFHGDWNTKPLGYGQIDIVVHSGPKLMGTMAYMVTLVEMHTYSALPKAEISGRIIISY